VWQGWRGTSFSMSRKHRERAAHSAERHPAEAPPSPGGGGAATDGADLHHTEWRTPS
jgi:hypothetical protein